LQRYLPCPDCCQPTTIGFEPRALRVRFACTVDDGHGFLRLNDNDEQPLALWQGGGLKYVAISMVAPVLAGDDDAPSGQACSVSAERL
jgi:hypothetical protein